MKLVSLPTIHTNERFEEDGNITLFFEFTDENYERLINYTDFDNVWEVLDALIAWSENCWNLNALEENEQLRPDYTAYEHTTNTDIHFFPV